MKKIICFLLTALMLFSLSACQSGDNHGVKFYYCQDPQANSYYEEDGVIQSEIRDLTGHRNDLHYMLGLYLAGPMEEGLTVSFSRQTRLLSVQQQDSNIQIELSDHTKALSDSEFSLSCACLTLTCMDFTQCQSVTITSGGRSVTMNRDNIILTDALPQQEATGG